MLRNGVSATSDLNLFGGTGLPGVSGKLALPLVCEAG